MDLGFPAVRIFAMVKLNFLIYSHSYTAGTLHQSLRLYSENVLWLSISSGAAADELQTVREIFQYKVNKESKLSFFEKTFRNQ